MACSCDRGEAEVNARRSNMSDRSRSPDAPSVDGPQLTHRSRSHQDPPVRSPRWLGALGVLVVYTLTMSRDLSLFDSPELALVAYELGLGHPPGQPLFTLVGYLFAHLPGVPPLFGLNFMSALAGALTVVPATRIAERMGGELVGARHALLIAVVALGALHPVLWEPATRVEVYSLATLFAVSGLERVQRALAPPTPITRVHPLIIGALLLGLSASVNPITALACTFAVTPAIISALAQRRVTFRVLGFSIVAGIVGLLPYLYVPLVANRTDALVWGAPNNAHDLLNYFLGSDYARNTGITFAEWLAHVVEWLTTPENRVTLIWIVIGSMFHVANGRRSGLGEYTSLSLLLTCVALVCANKVFRVDNPDYNGYVAAPFWLCVAGVAAGVSILWPRAIRLALALAAFAVLATMAVVPRSRADDQLMRTFVRRPMQAVPFHAIVVVESDHWIAPALYLQRVEKLRPDLVVLGAGLTASSWYWDLIYRAHPDLHPFELRAPGGRDARMRRFIESQPGRSLLVEHMELAARLGVEACAGGPLLPTGDCRRSTIDAQLHARTLAAQLDRTGGHVPLATELLSLLSLQRGEDLWRLGAPSAALHTLLAGVPASMRKDAGINWKAVSQVPPLRRPPVSWQRQRVLGEPARNLYVAAELLFYAGQRDAAQTLATAAANEGLPEATP